MELTYEELNARANVLARRLRAHGARAESLVVVCLPRSVELLVGFLAVMKAGGAYVPLSAGDPDQRRRHIVQDVRPTVVITDAAHRDDKEFAGSTALCVDELLESFGTAGPAERGNLDEEVGPEQLAYVIYTSGSSGRPKGVMCPHHGVANYLDWADVLHTLCRVAGNGPLGLGNPRRQCGAVDLPIRVQQRGGHGEAHAQHTGAETQRWCAEAQSQHDECAGDRQENVADCFGVGHPV